MNAVELHMICISILLAFVGMIVDLLETSGLRISFPNPMLGDPMDESMSRKI